MEQILNGNFEYEVPKLLLSCEQITERIQPGESRRGELYLGTEDNRKLKGYANSTHRRMVLGKTRFSGSTVHLPYGIDVAGLQPGDRFEGQIVLSTNVGEYQIPFTISVEKDQLKSSTREIETLDDFTRLAKEDFREAFRLFTSDSFARQLAGQDPREQALYLAMSENPVTYQHLEEYLIAMGQKEPVHLSLKEPAAAFYQVTESRQETCLLQRSGWGSLRLEIETEGDFLEVGRRVVTEEDFIGSTYALEYLIQRGKLGRGRHFGRIRIKSPYQTLVYEVTASGSSQVQVNRNTWEKKQKLSLLQEYLRLRLGKSEEALWMAESFHTISQLRSEGFDFPEYQLYEAYLYHRREEDQKAVEILKIYQDKAFTREDLELAGVYLYLCYQVGLLKQKGDICRKVRSFYQQRRDSYLLLSVLLALDETYEVQPSLAIAELESIFELGCRSPFLYLEAWKRVEQDMSLLHRVSGLWTQVFLFAARQGMLTEELSMRLAYLSGYEKKFSRSLFRALCLAYEAYPTNDTLDAICKHIMKGEPYRREFFPWYALAVEKGLRLTRLYEYYIETMNPQNLDSLPLTLRMYFAYHNALSDQKKAYVYANVIHHKEKDPDTYESYREAMKAFAVEKLSQGKVGEDYAVLYQEFAGEPAILEQVEKLSKMLFTYRLYCDDKKVRQVAVRHSQMQKEELYPCKDGVAYPRIYTEDAVIVFVDEKQRRYVNTVDYNLRRLMDKTALLPVCLEKEVTEPGVLLSLCQDGQVTEDNVALYQRLEEQEALSGAYRMEIRRKLLDFYGSDWGQEEQEAYVRQMDYEAFARVDKKALLEILISGGRYRAAYDVFSAFGGEGVATESMLKLCSRMILERELEEDEELLELCDAVYREGKYDEVMLTYLLKYYQGALDQMFRIWESARGFQLDTYAYEERLLLQCMFVGDYRPQGTKVLEAYVSHVGREKVIRSYLTFQAYGNFYHNQKLQPYVRKCLQTAVEREWELDMVCHLALLQSYARHKDWMGKWLPQLRFLLEEALSQGILLACYRRLPSELLSPWQLDDKVFVEHKGNPDSKVMLHYRLDTGLGNEPGETCEPLKMCFPGVFARTFTLFYGETLRYFFTEECGEHTEKTTEKVITMNRVEEEGRNKYQMLNQMLAAKKLGKDQEVLRRLREFLRQERYVKEMYKAEKE